MHHVGYARHFDVSIARRNSDRDSRGFRSPSWEPCQFLSVVFKELLELKESEALFRCVDAAGKRRRLNSMAASLAFPSSGTFPRSRCWIHNVRELLAVDPANVLDVWASDYSSA